MNYYGHCHSKMWQISERQQLLFYSNSKIQMVPVVSDLIRSQLNSKEVVAQIYELHLPVFNLKCNLPFPH